MSFFPNHLAILIKPFSTSNSLKNPSSVFLLSYRITFKEGLAFREIYFTTWLRTIYSSIPISPLFHYHFSPKNTLISFTSFWSQPYPVPLFPPFIFFILCRLHSIEFDFVIWHSGVRRIASWGRGYNKFKQWNILNSDLFLWKV